VKASPERGRMNVKGDKATFWLFEEKLIVYVYLGSFKLNII
jgi:hypothetical protein